MKFSYRILPEQRLCVLRFSGSVSISDVTRHIQEFWADSRFNSGYNGIVDMDGVTTRAKVEDLKGLLHFLENQKSTYGWWVAILSEPKPTALALIFKATFAGSFKFDVVSSWEAACRLLQITEPEKLAAVLS